MQALSRSLYARLIPPERSAEFFGLYNMMGKFAVIMGPILMGLTSYLFKDTRLSILSLLFLFLVGGGLLILVKVPGEETNELRT